MFLYAISEKHDILVYNSNAQLDLTQPEQDKCYASNKIQFFPCSGLKRTNKHTAFQDQLQ